MMVLVFWTAWAIYVFWKIYLPSIKIIRNLEPDNLVVRWSWLCVNNMVNVNHSMFTLFSQIILDEEPKRTDLC